MLHLHQSYCAHPSGQLLHLVLPHHSVLVCSHSPHHSIQLTLSTSSSFLLQIPSSSSIHPPLPSFTSLAFSDAFPHSLGQISSIAVDPGMKLVCPIPIPLLFLTHLYTDSCCNAHSSCCLVSLSGVQQDTWRIHSTLILPPSHTITAVDSKSGSSTTYPLPPISHLN